MINIYLSTTTDFENNGITALGDTKSCIITEEMNGLYELELIHPIDERGKWEYLVEENIIKANGQLFRIYHKKKVLSEIVVNARHIFYDLLDNMLEDVRPTGLSGVAALDWILARTAYEHPFNAGGDLSTENTKYFIRMNPVEAILGDDGIVVNWGGEIDRNNFDINILSSRGEDRGVLISYGKNIQGIEESLDKDGLITRMMPLGQDGLMLTDKYIDSAYINNYPHPKIGIVEFSDCEDEASLLAAANAYFLDNTPDVPQFSYAVDFLELTKTEEYKNYSVLQTCYMGDTVTIRHEKLKIDLKAKVISIVYDALGDRINNIVLGNFKSNLATSISKSIQVVKKQVENAKSFLEDTIEDVTIQINSALGGYVTKRNGELLIMDTEDVNTAVKVWRWNLNGLGYSSTGYNGEFATAITADGHFVADFMDTGTLTANIIKGGLLSSLNELFSLNMETGEVIAKAGITITGDNVTDLMEMFLTSTLMQIRVKATQSIIAEFTTDGTHTPNLTVDNVVKIAETRITPYDDGTYHGIVISINNRSA